MMNVEGNTGNGLDGRNYYWAAVATLACTFGSLLNCLIQHRSPIGVRLNWQTSKSLFYSTLTFLNWEIYQLKRMKTPCIEEINSHCPKIDIQKLVYYAIGV